MDLELAIEQVILDGFAPGDAGAIGAALERELGRLLAEQGPPRALRSSVVLPRLDAGAFEAGPGATPEAVGAGLASAIYRGLGR